MAYSVFELHSERVLPERDSTQARARISKVEWFWTDHRSPAGFSTILFRHVTCILGLYSLLLRTLILAIYRKNEYETLKHNSVDAAANVHPSSGL